MVHFREKLLHLVGVVLIEEDKRVTLLTMKGNGSTLIFDGQSFVEIIRKNVQISNEAWLFLVENEIH